jgi:D-xylose transport system substrate-binding protein
MWKRSIRSWIAIVAVLGLIAAACGDDGGGGGGGDGDGGGGSIWVLLPDSTTSPRWEGEDRPALKAALEAEGLVEGEDFSIVNAEGDATTQQSQAEQAIADGASAIILASVDTASGATIIDTAEAEGVEVIEYDRFNTEGPGGIAYVSFDNVQVGRTMADVLTPEIDALPVDTPAVVMLNGGEEDNNSFLFRQGYAETVDAKVEAGEWTLVADQHVPGWGANGEGQGIMEGILVDADNKVDAVFAANDNLAQQAINALQAAGVGPIPISGQDASVAGMQNILLGLQTMSVYKPVPAEADVAVAIAMAVRNGEDPTAIESDFDFDVIGIDMATGEALDSPDAEGAVPYYATVPIGVTADNMADTVIADGFLTIEEICAGDVAETDFCKENM